jgi:hypothetical protein
MKRLNAFQHVHHGRQKIDAAFTAWRFRRAFGVLVPAFRNRERTVAQVDICNLNWQDLDIAKRELRVLHAKGNKGRLCPLGQYALDALLEYARQYEGSHAVFLSQWDRRILTRTIPRTITKWVTKSGIKKAR